MALHASREKQACNIRASDEKHDSRSARHYPQAAAGILACRAGMPELFPEILNHQMTTLIGGRIGTP
jgi:hypothetical protein